MALRNTPGPAGPIRRAVLPAVLALADAIAGRGRARRPEARIDAALLALTEDRPDPARPLGRAGAVLEALHIVADPSERDALLDRLLDSERVLRVGFLNAHAVNIAWRDPGAARSFLALDLLLRDGIGLKMALRGLGRNPGLNMNGTDLIPEILARARNRPLAIYGTEDPWLSRAAERLAGEGHEIADTCHGFLDDDAYADRLAGTSAGIVLLAMGMPKQERVARTLQRPGGTGGAGPMLVLCGGAIVDFLSERHRRAPEWMRRNNLEWVFRLLSEPRRLFRRYVIGNASFLWRVSLLPGRPPARAARALLTWMRQGFADG